MSGPEREEVTYIGSSVLVSQGFKWSAVEGSKIITVGLPKWLGGTAWNYSGARRFGEGGAVQSAGASAKVQLWPSARPSAASPRLTDFANEKA